MCCVGKMQLFDVMRFVTAYHNESKYRDDYVFPETLHKAFLLKDDAFTGEATPKRVVDWLNKQDNDNGGILLKNYLITDPCYIMPADDWRACIGDREKQQKALRDYTEDGAAIVAKTGYGDWVNYVRADHCIMVYSRDFAADSGLVCFCKVDDDKLLEIQKRMSKNAFFKLVACLKTGRELVAKADYTCEDWTVIRIYDAENGKELASTREAI